MAVERVEPGGRRVALREDGSLDSIDEYAMTDARTLRWRSRLPSDSPFAGTSITYAIHYRLSRILRLDGERYLLDHDFAFPDRVGTIDGFTLQLDLEPAWRPLASQSETVDVGS